MSRYARVLERDHSSVSNPPGVSKPATAEAARQAEVSSRHSASTLLPRDGAWRQELERLRGAIVLANQLRAVQVILLCGARSDDGATSVAAHLALALAEMEETQVALADVSQSKPGVERFLNGALPGRRLKEVLPHSSNLSIQQTSIEDLHLVTTGNGMSLMMLLQPVDLLRRLRERFRYVILSAPPVVAHPDTALLATKADGVILVAQAGKSRLEHLGAAKTEFERVGANILGVVLNRRKDYLPKLLTNRM
jgi:non-specific protein-tyrosine kinase